MSARSCMATAAVALLAGVALSQTTTEVSVTSQGIPSNGAPNITSMHLDLSPDGLVAAFTVISTFHGNTNAFEDLYVHDRATGVTSLVSADPSGAEANNRVQYPSLSSTGRYVAFSSMATNLVPADTTNDHDVFVRDVLTGTTELVTVNQVPAANTTGRNPTISHDGRFVAYNGGPVPLPSGGSSLGLVVFDRQTQTAVLANYDEAGNLYGGGAWPANIRPLISGDGNHVAFHTAGMLVSTDTNGASDVYVRHLASQTTELVSLTWTGSLGNGGSMIATIPGGDISADGRFVAFWSDATNLVPGDTNLLTDVFVRDTLMGTTVRASISTAGVEGDGVSRNPRLSDDGLVVAFESQAANLVAVDTNLNWDVFARDLGSATTEMVNVSNDGGQPSIGLLPAVSSDGSLVAFSSPGNTMAGAAMTAGPLFSGSPDVYVRDRKGAPCPISTYCVGKKNSQSLTPQLGATGAPRLSGTADAFRVWVFGVVPGKPGLVFWGRSSSNAPFSGGTLCVGGTKHRLPAQIGSTLFTHSQLVDQAFMASSGWVAGTDVFMQFWGRDTLASLSLSDGLQITVCP